MTNSRLFAANKQKQYNYIRGGWVARVNVEDSLFKDQRYLDLMIELKSSEIALGALVRCWIVAQQFWKNSDNGIPKKEWKKQKLNNSLITCGLAEDRGDFVFIIGSEKHFAWVREYIKSGRKGGLKLQEKIRGDAKATLKQTLSEFNPLTLTLSSSSSSSSDSRSNSNKEKKKNKSSTGVKPPMDANKNSPTWEAYRDAYAKRYGEPPIRNASVNAKVAQFVNRVGVGDSPGVAEFYLTHNDAFYVKSMHPVGLLLKDAEKLRTEWVTGMRMTGATAREVERMQHNSDTWDEAFRITNDRRLKNETV